MKNPEPGKGQRKKLPLMERKAVLVGREELVHIDYLEPGRTPPCVIRPAVAGLDLAAWATENREFIRSQLSKHGALLLRNFGISTVAEFEQVIGAICGELMEYRERSSPRTQVSDRVYTSTDYPADQSIFPHNEHSYSRTFPLKLFFFCLTPARQGGETPLADTRKIFQRIDAKIRERFIQKKWRYVRNFDNRFGLSWQTAFQTTDRGAVESYCRRNAIEFKWNGEYRLRTYQIRPAVATHPLTGEIVWFNHATFFHVSTLEPAMRDALLAEFKEEDLPNNTYYGDGSPIEPSVIDALREAYRQEMAMFAWKSGDILALDNMLTAHARMPFIGPRKVLFAMAEPFTRMDI